MEEALDYEDLRAFERRLTEVVASYRILTLRWRIILILLANLMIIGAYSWLEDLHTSLPFTQSIRSHPVFSVAALLFTLLIFLGKQKLIFAGKIMAIRTNGVLEIFNMECNEVGKLKMKS
ncbi:nuclear envelope phosphatase-regulatory subunit 1 homolog [Drosophila serrata]|uniref:nuclear envelope phosphatase-regulatory subunit 1 homolog n=1 Tax=Drosophila serrata TaxID=7274 RepID=UPI000A1D01FA|nr:nuclear envelope phosphatase-regulatory subunit 1 homolog [Drosophila serrata]